MHGCQKRMYCMKNVGGLYFEEVYFVLKKTAPDAHSPLGSRDLAGEAERIVREAKEQARMEGDRMLADVRRQIQSEKEDAIRDIRRQVAVLSVDIAEKVLRKNLDTDQEQMQMIDRMLDELTHISKN